MKNSPPYQSQTTTHSMPKEERDLLHLQSGQSHKVSVYQHEVKIETVVPNKKSEKMPVRHERDIKGFSKNARRRMMRTMNRIMTPALSVPIFISLTYRHGELPVEDFQYKFFKIFLPRLKKIVPEECHLWRLEAHKSGYPHFHLLVWSKRKNLNTTSEYYKKPIRKAWRNAIGQHDQAAQLYSCKIEDCDSWNKVKAYVSKYLAKTPKAPELKVTGRRWGRSSNLPVAPITEAYITKTQFKAIKEIIRAILVVKKTPKGLIEAILRSKKGLFVWLSEDEIEFLLEDSGLSPPLSDYSHFRKHGTLEFSDEELKAMAEMVA